MFLKRKKRRERKQLTPEEIEARREYEEKKDLAWMILIVYLFLIPYTLHYLIEHDALNIVSEISLAFVFSSIFMWGPHILYSFKPVRDYFAAFNGKAAESPSPDERAMGALTYNAVFFVGFAMAGFYLANIISAVAFHKNTAVNLILIVVFDAGALYLSKWLTDRKYKIKRGK